MKWGITKEAILEPLCAAISGTRAYDYKGWDFVWL